MEAQKTAPEEPTKLDSNQAPKTLSDEPTEQQVQNTAVSQGFRDAVYSIWLSRTRNQIKHVSYHGISAMLPKLSVGQGRNPN